MKRSISILLLLAVATAPLGCATNKGTGTIIGAGAGGVVGGVIGDKAGNTAVGAILGAAIGGAAGAWIGNYMDEQAEEIRQDIEGAEVERIGEGIKITFDSGILFASNQATLEGPARANIEELARILKKYEDTNVLIEGHTDSQGSEDYNLELSRRRAQSVANYLAGQQVDATRFTLMGYGETQPVASNETPEGRRENRRVEIAIMANDELKAQAERIAD
ncbi:MAG TPA: OmpA family protein [Candidatus Krumholzibacteria bacterium]|nr:OmpA family protein [Candidatus Krumholzibacteria bacterium]